MRILGKSGEANGFTLVELLISVFLSSIVMAAAFALFISTNKVFHSSSQKTMLQQTARAALDLMAGELVQVGLGQVSPNEAAGTNLYDQAFIDPESNNDLGSSGYNDEIQFIVSQGGMVVLASNDGETLDNLTNTVKTLNVFPDPLDSDDWTDLFRVNQEVWLLDRQRHYLAAGIFTGSGSTGDDKFINVTFNPSGFEDDLPTETIELVPGMVLVERPTLLTYTVHGGRLVRCAEKVKHSDTWAIAGCDDKGASGETSLMNPVSYLTILDSIEAFQVSYYVPPLNEISSGKYEWEPFPTSVEYRRRILAVRLEFIVKSVSSDPLLTDGSAFVKKNFFLGNVTVTPSYVVDGKRIVYERAQVATVVRLPNMIIGQDWW